MEIFNFKDAECQQKFFQVTENTTKLSSSFENDDENFMKQCSRFFKTLNGTFHQCFKKIRIKNKTSTSKNDEIQIYLELRTKLQMLLTEAKSLFSKQIIERKLEEITERICSMSSIRNVKIINDQLGQICSDGTFSRIGVWKVKSKLFPNKLEVPFAKKNIAGNLITAVEPLKKLYVSTYLDRLRHRPIRDDLKDLLQLKTDLWEERLEQIKANVSQSRSLKDIDKVIRSLKNNQTRDPNGMINELLTIPDSSQMSGTFS